jgi:hypothetical protein
LFLLGDLTGRKVIFSGTKHINLDRVPVRLKGLQPGGFLNRREGVS